MSEKERPKVGLGVIVIKKDKVLLGKRKNAHGTRTWCFPGGHLKFYKAFQDCALREIQEETWLIVDLIDTTTNNVTNDFFVQEKRHYIALYLRTEYVAGKPEVNEPEKWDWFEWNKLPKPLFLPIVNLLKQEYNHFI